MEGFSTENMQVDEEGREISQYCLGIPTILRKLLEQFSTTDLLQLSLVNKQWNFEARSVMRERGNVIAIVLHSIFKVDNQCQRLSQFASDLENMSVIPFSGIHLDMSHPSGCCRPSNGPQLDPSHNVILDLLPWKYFSVSFQSSWDRCKDCPAILLVKHILEDYCGLLEELTLSFGNEEFLEPIFQGPIFPRLKYLTIETMDLVLAENSFTSNFVKALVASAQNLQELRMDAIHLTVNVFEGSSAVLVPTNGFYPLSQPICGELIGSIRARFMDICVNRDEFDPELLNGVIPMLLKGSRTTLKTLFMDFFFAVPLMCYGVCLENVTTLEIRVNFESLGAIEPWILALAKCFDFTRVFPRLNRVGILEDYEDHLEFSSDVVSGFVQQADAVLSRELPDRAINIKQLDLVLLGTLEDSSLSLLAQIFPDVQTVHTRKEQKGASFTNLREYFQGVEKVIEYIDS